MNMFNMFLRSFLGLVISVSFLSVSCKSIGEKSNASQTSLTRKVASAKFKTGYLRKKNAESEVHDMLLVDDPFFTAVRTNNLSEVRKLIETGNHTAKYDRGLIGSALLGHLEIVQELIKAGTNVNATVESGQTALMGTVIDENLEVVRELIKAGANVNVRDDAGMTALMWAVAHYIRDDEDERNPKAPHAAKVEIVRELIKAGANVNAVDARGDSSIMWAAQGKYLEIIRILCAMGATIDDKSISKLTELEDEPFVTEITNICERK